MQLKLKVPEKKTIVLILIIIGFVNILFWLGGPRFILFIQDTFTPFSSGWEAVYLNNGEVYVGHIRGSTRQVIKLSDAYILNVVKSGEAEAASRKFNVAGSVGNNISLIKWGFYQPLKSRGELFISRSNVLFWEKLDKDSEVVKQLEQQKD